MTDCGCLGNARELRRELAPAPDAAADPFAALRARLAAWRAEMGFSDPTLHYLIGIGAETCQRIERGEVDPEPDVAARIEEMFDRSPVRLPHSDASCPRRASVLPATPTAGREGGAAAFPPVEPAVPLAADYGPPVRIPPPSPALAKGDDGTFHVEMFLGLGIMLEMDLEEAAQLAAELAALVALARTPDLYDHQPRLARPSTEES